MQSRFPIYLALLIFLSISQLSCSSTKQLSEDGRSGNFSLAVKQNILSESADSPMRVFKTDSMSDSLLLRQRSEQVNIGENNIVLQHFVDRLFATVRDSMSLGVGIAAPQVGVLKNIIWVQRFDKEGFPFEVYLNPVIKQYSAKKQDCMEGCLSIPDKRATTKTRAYAILLEYDKMDGSHEVEMVEDFTAVIFQHEIDHLHGILFVDILDEKR